MVSLRTLDDRFDEVCHQLTPEGEVVVVPPPRGCREVATFAEVRDAAINLSGGLMALGVNSESTAVLFMPSWIEAIITFQALVHLRAKIVPLIHVYGFAELAYAVRKSEARYIVLPTQWHFYDMRSQAEQLSEEFGNRLTVISVGHDPSPGCIEFNDLLASSATSTLVSNGNEGRLDTPHVLAFTSGSTADPKGVVHTEATTLATVDSIIDAFDVTADDVIFNPNPVGHASGMLCSYYVPFLVGSRRLVMFDGWEPRLALRTCREHAATIMGGAPLFLSSMMQCSDFNGGEGLALKACALGSSDVPSDLLEAAESAGIPCVRTYGLTEQPSVTMGRITDPLVKRSRTDGRPTLGTNVRVLSLDGDEQGPGQEGQIWVKGLGQFIGYWQDGNIVRATDDDGWFATGDLGRLDDDGYLTVTGRVKDIIIRGGRNISALEIEAVIRAIPVVRECAVVGLRGGMGGEIVCAFVTLESNAALTQADLARHFRASGLASYKVPRRIVTIDEFPKTLAGKVQKHRLAALAGEPLS